MAISAFSAKIQEASRPAGSSGMGAAEEEHRPAGLLPFEDVDVGVVDRALDRLEIIAERGHARDPRPGHDGLGQVPAAVEAQPGQDGQDGAEPRDDGLADHLSLSRRRRKGMRTMM